MFKSIAYDIKAILDRDPAARNGFEVFLLYPGFHALLWHRVAHFFYRHHLKFIARLISQLGRFFTGIEIHPGARIGRGLMIDHGMGVVIGETAVIGDNCTIYQGVTLGGTGKECGKRHPTLGDEVMVGSGAKVLGPFKVGDRSKIAAGAVVLSAVPPDSTCVGVPARVVKVEGKRVENDLDQVSVPDPVASQMCTLNVHVRQLEKKLEKLKAELEILEKENQDENL